MTTTIELIEQHKQRLTEAEALSEALGIEWEQGARSGADVSDIEDRIDVTARLVKRLSLRLETLDDQLAYEAEQDRISRAAALRDQVISKYQTLAADYSKIKAAADKLTAQLERFNQQGIEVSEVDIRRLKQLGGSPLPHEIASIFVGHTFDSLAFDDAWRTTHHMAVHGLESAAYIVG
jgi:DNA repair exonuclease SbcCD ATPase subunit